MELNWIRVEDEMPVDNGKVQKILVCINRRTSCFKNCDIEMCHFSNRFHLEELPIGHHSKVRITHWAKIEKPKDLG